MPSYSAAFCGAVVVCFHPPPGLAERLLPLSSDLRRIVLVDNGPAESHAALAASLTHVPNLEIIANGRNLGIAAALNQGLQTLAAGGIRWALLLDHDSRPSSSMLNLLLDAAQQEGAADAAAFVPEIRYALPEIVCRWPVTPPGSRYRFKRISSRAMRGPTAVDLAISSGMLLDLDKIQQLGWFRSGMFIDLVDTELCLRARRHGYRVMAVPNAVLGHALGDVRRGKLLGIFPVYPTHHSPIRHYYLARNRVHLWKLYGRVFPSWAFYEFVSGVKLLLKSLIYEPDRWPKLRVTLLGTWEGIRTRPPALDPADGQSYSANSRR